MFLAMVVIFDDVEMALLVSLYVVLVQSLIELEPTFAYNDHILQEGIVGTLNIMDSHDLQLAISTVLLFDYWLVVWLICFDDTLQYWVKPYSTTWFSDFMMRGDCIVGCSQLAHQKKIQIVQKNVCNFDN